MKREDQEAIRRIRKGEAGAFEGIVKRYEEKIFNFGLRMCGATEDARDLLQETFLTAFTHIKDFRGEAELSTWLYKIASSICIKKRRRGKFEPRHVLSYDDLAGEEISAGPGRMPFLPDENVLRGEVKDLITRSLQALPANYRIVLVLRDMEGLPSKTVGQTLGISEEAVKSRLHRARLFMREQLRGLMQ